MSPSAPNDLALELSQLLAAANARPTITPTRVAPSTLHDATYHLAIVACAMHLQTVVGEAKTRILAARLQLLQFVAARPSLVDDLCRYVQVRGDRNLSDWSRMPRGYLGDQTHEQVIDLLVAAGVLQRSGDCLESAAHYESLEKLANHLVKENLFAGERQILSRLRDLQISKTILEGT